LNIHHQVVGPARWAIAKGFNNLGRVWLLLVSDKHFIASLKPPGVLPELINKFHGSVCEGLVTGKCANAGDLSRGFWCCLPDRRGRFFLQDLHRGKYANGGDYHADQGSATGMGLGSSFELAVALRPGHSQRNNRRITSLAP